MPFVIDNSITSAWVVLPQATDYSDAVLARAQAEPGEGRMPAIWELEFGNLLRTACLRKRFDASTAQALLARIEEIGLVVDRSARPLSEILALALRHGLSTYDAAYLDLALRLQCPLATQHAALRDAAMACGVGVLKP
jgi:predicted nucleic acid-binding protein